MTAYYNEHDPYAAQWLRNLIAAGHIAAGDVDERSIVDVSADDLRGYTQCHFFAGIGGWSLALRLAGVPDDRPVWTGSCPCQPFSAAGRQRGSNDERHLWPAFFDLIRERRPAIVFGEQVAGAAGLAWLDHVCADLEGAGYAAAAADLPACSVGAPHRRQRLFWVADGQERGRLQERADSRGQRTRDRAQGWPAGSVHGSHADALADPDGRHTSPKRQQRSGEHGQQPQDGGAGRSLDHAERPRLEGHGAGEGAQRHAGGAWAAAGPTATAGASNPWSDLAWIACSDGKARPTQPGLFPLAHGVSGRVGRLRAYGNAIVPQVAAAFITGCLTP